MVGRPVRTAGCHGCSIPIRRRGVLSPNGDGHRDDERKEAVVSGPLGVHGLRFGGTPWPVRLLINTPEQKYRCLLGILSTS